MPEGLLDPLSRDEVRDLFAYLKGHVQAPLPPGTEADAGTGTRRVMEDQHGPPCVPVGRRERPAGAAWRDLDAPSP